MEKFDPQPGQLAQHYTVNQPSVGQSRLQLFSFGWTSPNLLCHLAWTAGSFCIILFLSRVSVGSVSHIIYFLMSFLYSFERRWSSVFFERLLARRCSRKLSFCRSAFFKGTFLASRRDLPQNTSSIEVWLHHYPLLIVILSWVIQSAMCCTTPCTGLDAFYVMSSLLHLL